MQAKFTHCDVTKSKRKTHHNWTNRSKLVVQEFRFFDVAGLEGQLQATVSHPEAHAVHVDVVWLGSAVRLGVDEMLDEGGWRVLVFENWRYQSFIKQFWGGEFEKLYSYKRKTDDVIAAEMNRSQTCQQNAEDNAAVFLSGAFKYWHTRINQFKRYHPTWNVDGDLFSFPSANVAGQVPAKWDYSPVVISAKRKETLDRNSFRDEKK